MGILGNGPIVGAMALALVTGACAPQVQEFAAGPGRDRCEGTAGYSAAAGGARTFIWRSDWLRTTERRLADPAVQSAYAALLAQADAALAHPAHTVIAKTATPPSGDKHDYLSMGTYFWPDPSRPGEYVRRDGQVHPSVRSERYDRARLERFSADVAALALAYRFTRDQRYAVKAAEMLRAWFLDPTTRMNPHLRFAQMTSDAGPGRAVGLIDTRHLTPVVDAIGLIERSGALTAGDLEGLRTWFRAYLDWFLTSDIGKEEAKARNNHGVHYDVQAVSFALFTGQTDVAERLVTDAADRIGEQYTAFGELPQELDRADAVLYSIFANQGFVTLAGLAECVGVDLWRYTGPDKQGIHAGLNRLADYAVGEAPWPAPGRLDEPVELYRVLMEGAWAYGDRSLAEAAAEYAGAAAATRAVLETPRF